MSWWLLLAMQAYSPLIFPGQFYVTGAGGISCARAFKPGMDEVSTSWVLGFLSGVNAAHGQLVGSKIDNDGIVGEVKLACERAPSDPLVKVTVAVVRKLGAENK